MAHRWLVWRKTRFPDDAPISVVQSDDRMVCSEAHDEFSVAAGVFDRQMLPAQVPLPFRQLLLLPCRVQLELNLETPQ